MKHSLARRNLRLFPALLTVGLLTAVPALAQPGMDGPDGPPGMNGGPGIDGGRGMDDRSGGRGGNRGGFGDMNGGERPDRGAMQVEMLKRSLQRAGYTDPNVVEAITIYATNRDDARKTVADAAGELAEALGAPDSTDVQISKLTDALDNAITAEKKRSNKAQAELDKQVKFSKTPKLKTVLMLSGLIGDTQGYIPPPPPPGRGGRNGGPGMDGRPVGPPGLDDGPSRDDEFRRNGGPGMDGGRGR